METSSSREFPCGPVVRTLLSLQRVQVLSLVWELRSCKPGSSAKINNNNNNKVAQAKELSSAGTSSF